MFYNTNRSISKQTKENIWQNGVQHNVREKLINIQKRERLKGLLITKFIKKYGIQNPEILIKDEITKFLQREKFTSSDLNALEKKIMLLLKKEEVSQENTHRRTLSQEPSISTSEVQFPPLLSPRVSASDVFTTNQNQKPSISEEEFDNQYMDECKKPLQRLSLPDDCDEWNALIQYNKNVYEAEKKMNKMKENECKRRAKEDLDNQVKQKQIREYEEYLKNQEDDKIMNNHANYVDQLDLEKRRELHNQKIREKENRDIQLIEERKKKQEELMKDKQYEKEFVKNIVDEIAKEKQMLINTKKQQKITLQKSKKDIEFNRTKQIEVLKQEKEEEIKYCQEYEKLLEKQENERTKYYNKIRQSAELIQTKMADSVLKDLVSKNKEEDEKMKQMLIEKEKENLEEDKRKNQKIHEQKKMLQTYLDMQVEEKKKNKMFEQSLDNEQARIWKIDINRYYEQARDIKEKTRKMHNINQNYLKNQIESKRASRRTYMTDTEYAMNKQALDNMVKSSS